MVNNRYHLLYHIASSAPPAGVVLSRFLGGGIGRLNVYERILREPSGIEFIDNQIMRESGVSGMKPMNEHELEEYIRMWLGGLQTNASTMSLPDLKDEMRRLKTALADTRLAYQLYTKPDDDDLGDIDEAKETDLVSILDALELTYKGMFDMMESLERENETDLKREMELRSRGYELTESDRAELERLIQKRKQNQERSQDLVEVQKMQDIGQETLEQEWIGYLQGLVDELQLARDKVFDANNPRESFRELLRNRIEQAQQADQANVIKYLETLRDRMGEMIGGMDVSPDFKDAAQADKMYPGYGLGVILSDIKDYYDTLKYFYQDSQRALQTGKEQIRRLKAYFPDYKEAQSVTEMIQQLLACVDSFVLRVQTLEESLNAVTAELNRTKATIMTHEDTIKTYKQVLDGIVNRFVSRDNQTQAQVGQNYENLIALIQENIKQIRKIFTDEDEKQDKMIDDQGRMILEQGNMLGSQQKEIGALSNIITLFLMPLNEILRPLYLSKTTGAPLNEDRIHELMRGLERQVSIAENEAKTAAGTLPEKITLMTQAVGMICNLIIRYERERLEFFNFMTSLKERMKLKEVEPEAMLQELEALNRLADTNAASMQASQDRITQLEGLLQEARLKLGEEQSNLGVLRDQNEQAMKNHEDYLAMLQRQIDADKSASEEAKARLSEQLQQARRELEQNRRDLAAAQTEAKQIAAARAELQEENRRLQQEKAEQEQTAAAMRDKVLGIQEMAARVKAQAEAAASKIREYDAYLQQIGANPASYVELSARYQQAQRSFEQTNGALRAQYDASLAELAKYRRQIEGLQQQIKANEEAQQQLRGDLGKATAELNSIRTEQAFGPPPKQLQELIAKAMEDPVNTTRLMQMFSYYYATLTQESVTVTYLDVYQMNYDLFTSVFQRIDIMRYKAENKRIAVLYEILYLIVFAFTGIWMKNSMTGNPDGYKKFEDLIKETWRVIIFRGGSSHISLSACWNVVLTMFYDKEAFWKIQGFPDRADYIVRMYNVEINNYLKNLGGVIEEVERKPKEDLEGSINLIMKSITNNGGIYNVPDIFFLAILQWHYLGDGDLEGRADYMKRLEQWMDHSKFFVMGSIATVHSPIFVAIGKYFASRDTIVASYRNVNMCAEIIYYTDAEALNDLDFEPGTLLSQIVTRLARKFKLV